MRHQAKWMQHFGQKRMMADLIVSCLTLFVFSIALAADAWNCPECGRTGNTGNYCGGCGYASIDIQGQTDDSSQEMDSTAEFKTVGNIVTFGRYEQDNKTARPEEIEWIVLDYDEKANRSLLLSKYGLDAKAYHESFKATTWKECTLRTWLNDIFLNNAFTTEEQAAILLTDVDNTSSQGYPGWSTSGGDNTQDKVFLLSYAEANKYLGVTYANGVNTKSSVAATDYAISRGAHISSDKKTDGMFAGWWWLRSPGSYQDNAARVSSGGALICHFVTNGEAVVRPALWINLKSKGF